MNTNEKMPPEGDTKQLDNTTELKPGQMTEEILLELGEMQKRYSEIYKMSGLIALTGYDGVHLTGDAFIATFPDYTVVERGTSEFPQELSTEFAGTRFFCVR